MIREDDIRAGALNSGHYFQHDALLVYPAVARGGFHHRVFSAHVVCRDGHIIPLTHALNDIEVGQGRLDHDHVRALFEVERDFAQSLARIGRIHLITAVVAKLRRRLRRFAQGRGIAFSQGPLNPRQTEGQVQAKRLTQALQNVGVIAAGGQQGPTGGEQQSQPTGGGNDHVEDAQFEEVK